MPKSVEQLFQDRGSIAQALLEVWEPSSLDGAKPAPRIPATPQHAYPQNGGDLS